MAALREPPGAEARGAVWDTVLDLTRVAHEKGCDPFLWAVQLTSTLNKAGVSLPSPDLAEFLVSYICWENNVPIIWKFLDRALAAKIAPPLLVIALLSSRVIPVRQSQSAAYRLCMELIRRYVFALKSHIDSLNYHKIMESIDTILQLYERFGSIEREAGAIMVEFIFSIVWHLLDASLDDEGLLELTPEKNSMWGVKSQDMEIDGCEGFEEKWTESQGRLQSGNTEMAIELIGQFLQNEVTSRILFLARQNLPTHWISFTQRLKVLGANSTALRNSKNISEDAFQLLTSDTQGVLSRQVKTNSKMFQSVLAFGDLSSSSLSDPWLPLDIILEDSMDTYQVNAASAIETITGLVKTFQAVNGTTWHDTLLNLWISALRLVQRESDAIDGPMPRLDSGMCMLLSIIPLMLATLIEEEENASSEAADAESPNLTKRQNMGDHYRRNDLISSLQMLGNFHELLAPPQSIVSAANQAAAKAMLFRSGLNVGSSYFECISVKEMPVNCSGNMRHLIVEACIARNLLDTSSYFWPGYVNGGFNEMPPNLPTQGPSWSSFMKGASLTPSLLSALVSTPASSFAELEKIFEIAVNGSEEEKISAATILSGASLLQGWNIQEHNVDFITRLLSPPVPADYKGDSSHLIALAPMLNVLIVAIGSVDCVQVFSLHGLVPQLACSLMHICEVFGSYSPEKSWTLTTGEEINAHAMFSNAFTLLLKLWRFNHPPIEHGIGDVPTVGSQLTPEYLLLLRNSHLVSSGGAHRDRNKRRLSAVASLSSQNPVFLDSFPKLKAWYRHHQACLASTLSGLVPGTRVHQTVDGLLTMMFRKINEGGQALTSVNSGSSSSSGAQEDSNLRPKLPAWDILEAVPYVVDGALAACAHGCLSPRALATGLKGLADFLPACLATIVSYFSAEVSRSIWKPVFMNGTDWPSPAANLTNVEEQIKKILATTGVNVPSLSTGDSSPTLPLPLAAFVSLTITYKIDKASQRFLNLAGPALESLAAGCPWPCMPIIASLWTQKAKRWSDFLIFSASRTVFLHHKDALVQLLKSCFTSTLGLSSSPLSSNGGVGALLGHGFESHFRGGISPVAPGIHYLRVYRSIRDIMFITEEILSLLMQSVREITCIDISTEKKVTDRTKAYGRVSLPGAMTRIKLAASLSASLVWLCGGLCLVQTLMKETLPSWFVSNHRSKERDSSEGMVAMLGGYALAYFMVLCGALAWGVDSSSSASKRRPKVLGTHMEFLASVLDGKISLGCDMATWQAYVSGIVILMVACTPNWVLEIDADVLKRLSRGLRQWNEDELALALLGVGGYGTMGVASELIIRDTA